LAGRIRAGRSSSADVGRKGGRAKRTKNETDKRNATDNEAGEAAKESRLLIYTFQTKCRCPYCGCPRTLVKCYDNNRRVQYRLCTNCAQYFKKAGELI